MAEEHPCGVAALTPGMRVRCGDNVVREIVHVGPPSYPFANKTLLLFADGASLVPDLARVPVMYYRDGLVS